MRLNEFTIDHGSNDNNRYLNTTYRRFLFKEVNSLINEDEIERWETYNMIANELITHGYLTEFDELKYRLIEYEDPNRIIADILSVIERTTTMSILLRTVESYIDDDFYSDLGL